MPILTPFIIETCRLLDERGIGAAHWSRIHTIHLVLPTDKWMFLDMRENGKISIEEKDGKKLVRFEIYGGYIGQEKENEMSSFLDDQMDRVCPLDDATREISGIEDVPYQESGSDEIVTKYTMTLTREKSVESASEAMVLIDKFFSMDEDEMLEAFGGAEF